MTNTTNIITTDRESLRNTLSDILDRYPLLSWRGFWSSYHERSEPAGTRERVRRETLEDHGIAQFERAMAFLAVAPRIQSPNLNNSMYGWKHVAERWFKTTIDAYADYYIGEGAFIAVCLASGMRICRRDASTFTNLSERALALGKRERF